MSEAVLFSLVVFALAAAPASAQGSYVATPEPSSPRRDDGSLYRGAYEVTEDGALICGGDVEYRCEDPVKMGASAEPGSGDAATDGETMEPLTREAVELCVEAGFPPEGVAPGTLPETGGPALPPLVLVVAGIVVGGLAVFRLPTVIHGR